MANASMIPAMVEPCLDTRRNNSPGRPSAYSPTVTNPLQSATRNSKVREVRVRGSFSRVGRAARATNCPTTSAGPAGSETAAAVDAAALDLAVPVLRGWATLQLSR